MKTLLLLLLPVIAMAQDIKLEKTSKITYLGIYIHHTDSKGAIDKEFSIETDSLGTFLYETIKVHGDTLHALKALAAIIETKRRDEEINLQAELILSNMTTDGQFVNYTAWRKAVKRYRHLKNQ